MRFTILILLFSGTALADPPAPAYSPAFQLAKRMAQFENNHDLPSRALWLGQKVAQNAHALSGSLDSKVK